MNKAFIKWGVICAIGVCLLIFTVLYFIRKEYTWIFATGFLGLFLISSAWKKIRLLGNAARAIKDGRKEIEIFYRDKNLKESQETVIPTGADAFWFYGYLPAKGDIKAFRWQGIKKALENGKELNKDDILESISIK